MTTRRTFLTTSATAAALASAPLSEARAGQRSPPSTEDRPNLYVKDWGSGPPVVLCHGWPLSADSWDAHACTLVEAGYRVIAPDRRGFGRSAQPARGYDYDTLADDLARILDAADVRDATLVGFSMGGTEVLRYLSRHGDQRVRQVAFVGAAIPYLLKTPDNPAGIDAQVFDGMKAGLRDDRPQFVARLLRDVIYDLRIQGTHRISEEVLAWSQQMALQAGLRGTIDCVDTFAQTDLRRDLAAVKVPALLLHGSADKPVPIALARQAAAGMTRAMLREYAGASHGILVTERTQVARDLLAFIAR